MLESFFRITIPDGIHNQYGLELYLSPNTENGDFLIKSFNSFMEEKRKLPEYESLMFFHQGDGFAVSGNSLWSYWEGLTARSLESQDKILTLAVEISDKLGLDIN